MEVLRMYGVGVRPLSDPFLALGDATCRMYTPKGIIDQDEEEFCHNVIKSFECHAPNCTQRFESLLNYEIHYNSCHRFTCSECKKQLPSPHLLDLHISETHDSFFLVQAERKPMYACFVENCSIVSKCPADRRKHCIEDHDFPHDFRFDSSRRKPNKGKQHPSPNASTEEAMSVDQSPESKKGKRSPTKGKGPPISFGHRPHGKTFLFPRKERRQHNPQQTEKNLEMQELMDSLPDNSS